MSLNSGDVMNGGTNPARCDETGRLSNGRGNGVYRLGTSSTHPTASDNPGYLLSGDGIVNNQDITLLALEGGMFSSGGDPWVSYPALASYRPRHSLTAIAPAPLCEFGHQGLPHDEELDGGQIVQNRNRFLHARLGRFGQRDPLGYPDGMNRYAAYHVMWGGVDPWGLTSRKSRTDILEDLARSDPMFRDQAQRSREAQNINARQLAATEAFVNEATQRAVDSLPQPQTIVEGTGVVIDSASASGLSVWDRLKGVGAGALLIVSGIADFGDVVSPGQDPVDIAQQQLRKATREAAEKVADSAKTARKAIHADTIPCPTAPKGGRYPDAKELGKRLGTNDKGFHQNIKPKIKKDFGPEMKKIGTTNPDIGVDGAGNIILKNPKTGKEINTGVPLDSYAD